MSWAGVKQRVMESVVGGSAADVDEWDLASLPDCFFDLTAVDAKGTSFPMKDLRGKVSLVVNVASK